ncbi:ABC transporter substrate-binding protein [Anaerotalea alkaliphila]|uniref:Extracellular solute-binding protein n=1 Tax=Anaerotalea alkaliphila TaxID=2662126 RepID=A0A7X5HXG0_9FIRM|nr:extracellular solute-binding protein [Anaerotalea alkaliphila]NDL68400.1 extracellular solute-binding protein [Anaerotalea alkaliphila]
MKKGLVILMLVVMVTGIMAGCSSKVAPEDTGTQGTEVENGSQEPVKLRVWHIALDAKRREAVQNAVKRFEDANPHITVEESAFENDPYKTSLATSMAAGEEPDIFISWGGGWLEAFIDEGKVLDIDEKIDAVADNYFDSALSLFEINGKRYGLPYSVGPSPVYYNKQIYAELGLEEPKTLAEFENNCDVLLENGYIPIALGNASQWPGALTFINLSLRMGGADTFLDAYNRENGVTFEDESFVKAGEIIQKWVQKGYYPEGANATNYDTGGSRMLFYSGQAAHIVQTNGLVANSAAEAPEFRENNLGFFVFPEIEGGKGTSTEILGGGNGYSIASSTKHPEEAFDLLVALTDKDFGQDSVDLASAVSGVKGVEISDPLIQKVQDLLVESTYIQNYYDQFLPPELGNMHKQTTYDLFGMTTTPEKAAADVEKLAVQILGPSN